MQNKELIEKWLSGSLTEAELASFQNTEDYRALIRLDDALQDYKAPEFKVEEELLALHNKKKSAAKVVQIRPFDVVLRVAAVISIVLLGYMLFFQENVSTITTGIGEKQMVSLPDRSSVQLNARSNLVYQAGKWENKRKVELSGEAYFIVAKGSRFDVNTKDGVISVLGTQFNVRSREAYFEVECYEGHVAVVTDEDTVHLLAGNGLRFIDGEKLLRPVKVSEPAWTRDESSFESVPYEEVLAEFERQFEVSIETKNVDLSKRFSGSFNHNDFDVAIQSIATPLNLIIEKTADNHIVLVALED
jgi:ferric-dicitrate binding protein FerR (iron transport regulator)